jgi:hypothetical protein
MARPQVADGEDGFHIWRVAANILNKQLHTASLGLGVELTTPRHKISFVAKCYSGIYLNNKNILYTLTQIC